MHKLREFEGKYESNFQILSSFSVQDVSCRLEFRLTGDLNQLVIPPKAQAPRFRDELWRHTCFEAFFQDEDSDAYWEFNFSPSRDWAIYRFETYRNRIEVKNLEQIELVIQQERYPDAFILKIDVKPKDIFKIGKAGLTAVLEHVGGNTSYWALAHARPKPDFHACESFLITT